MNLSHKLKYKVGSSVAEFVIIAPLLSLLALAAYDLNKRAEDAQSVLIVARNAAYLGQVGGDDSFARERVLKGLTDYDATRGRDRGMGGIIDASERIELAQDPAHATPQTNPTQSGTRLALTGLDLLSEDDLKMMAQPSAILPVAGAFSSSYNLATSAIDVTLPTVRAAMDAYGSAFQISGLDPRGSTRKAAVDIKLSGGRNAMVRSMGYLSDMVGKTGSAPLEKQLSSRISIMGLSAYHTADYNNGALVGAGLGVIFHDEWGSNGSFSASSDHLQTRCMSRLSMEPSCETAHPTQANREFLTLIRALAAAKYTLSATLAVGTLGIGAGVQEAITAGINAEVESLFQDLGSKMTQTGVDMIRDYAEDRLQPLTLNLDTLAERDFSSFAKDFIPETNVVKSIVGE